MTPQEEKYLEKKLQLVEAAVGGAIMAEAIFGGQGSVRYNTKGAMKLIKQDIIKIYKYAKKRGRV